MNANQKLRYQSILQNSTFAVLAVAPLLVVYWLSLQFLNRGIDSWFDVNVRQGFEDALTLSRSSLSLRMGDFLARTAVGPRPGTTRA